MRRRYMYALLFGMPAFLLSVILTVALVAAITGALWIFVFGDDVWPSFASRAMLVLMFIIFGAVWFALLRAAYFWGKREEGSAALNKSHVFYAVGSSLGLVLLALLHQLNVGNIGPKSDSVVCGNFCATKNFSSSMLPQDGTCRCLGSGGREDLVLSMKALLAGSK